MSKKTSAGLMPAAVAENRHLRAEWVDLKDSNMHEKSRTCIKLQERAMLESPIKFKKKHKNNKHEPAINEIFYGVVALVEVGSEARALALRAGLTALGASVVPVWSPLVTHVIWAKGGSRATRAVCRSQAAHLVSPLWVEACSAAGKCLPERAFPAAARPSDLPSPKALHRLLKRAEKGNEELKNMLVIFYKNEVKLRPNQKRVLQETVTSKTATSENSTKLGDKADHTKQITNTYEKTAEKPDKSADKSADESVNSADNSDKSDKPKNCFDKSGKKLAANDTSNNTTDESTDVEMRVNTAPRRALPVSLTPPTPQQPKKSRRKLFTQLGVTNDSTDSEAEPAVVPKRKRPVNLTQRDRAGMARAERLARKLISDCAPLRAPPSQPMYCKDRRIRIVLSGMSRDERSRVYDACRALKAKVQSTITRKTTHVLLGSFGKSYGRDPEITGLSIFNNIGGRVPGNDDRNLRTLNALMGAARGCRVLYAKWALDSFQASKWLSHYGYEVPHLKRIAQKAYAERHAFGLMQSDYGYDVFNGTRIRLSPSAEQRSAALQLLALCGAVVLDETCGVLHTLNSHLLLQRANQNDARILSDYDLTVGAGRGEVNSLWVFDSVTAGRMRNTRKYFTNGG